MNTIFVHPPCHAHPQGFAFISFISRQDAQKAIESLDGFGYDHLILKVEWAK